MTIQSCQNCILHYRSAVMPIKRLIIFVLEIHIIGIGIFVWKPVGSSFSR